VGQTSTGTLRAFPQLALSMLAVLALVLSLFATATPVLANPSLTGKIAVFKTMCQEIGQQDTCNGRDTSLNNYMIDFQVFAGTATSGTPVTTLTVTLS